MNVKTEMIKRHIGPQAIQGPLLRPIIVIKNMICNMKTLTPQMERDAYAHEWLLTYHIYMYKESRALLQFIIRNCQINHGALGRLGQR